jgi:hypothetical protein
LAAAADGRHSSGGTPVAGGSLGQLLEVVAQVIMVS